mgnify:CR=1 FL=1
MRHYIFYQKRRSRSAGAHFFVSQNGDVQQSIPLKYTAYSVGDSRNGKGPYFGKCTNSNSVSIEMPLTTEELFASIWLTKLTIEMCDQLNKDASAAQIAAVCELIAFIKSQCPNVVDVIRHADVTTKSCPLRYLNNQKWAALKAAVTTGAAAQAAPAVSEAPATLTVDGWVGALTVRKWQRVLGTPEDGVISGQTKSLKKYHLHFTNSAIEYGSGGSTVIRAVQRAVGVDADGLMGPQTIKALQQRLGVYADGYFGDITARALQERLNTGSF